MEFLRVGIKEVEGGISKNDVKIPGGDKKKNWNFQ